jgi:DinB superfamily
MHAKNAILQSIGMADMIMGKYLDDLSDEAFFVKPVEGMNHIAWQVGHLISSERSFIEGVKPGSCPPLPEGFDAMHKKETTGIVDPSKFHTKAEYLAAWKAQRAATKAALEATSDADLDAPAPESIRSFVPTVGHVFNLTGLHALMHVGQFVAVRREQKLPVVF